jgi:hypothetical protein
MSSKKHNETTLLPMAPLLVTETADDYNAIRDALTHQIKPRGILDEIYVVEVADLNWEIQRLRRWKTAILNTAFVSALEGIFDKLLKRAGYGYLEATNAARDIAQRWFTNRQVRKKGAKLLRQFKLDESAIEAEAFRNSSKAIELLDRLLASAEARRNKALRAITEYRSGLARQLEESSDRIIDGEVLAVDDGRGEKPEAA